MNNHRYLTKNIFNYSAKTTSLEDKKLDYYDTSRLFANYSSDSCYKFNFNSNKYDFISDVIENLLGYGAKEIQKIGLNSLIIEAKIINGDHIYNVESAIALDTLRIEKKALKWQADYLVKSKNGKLLWISDISYPWIDDKKQVVGAIGCLRDINERVNLENHYRQELLRIANTDYLTGIGNRRYFFDHLNLALKRNRQNCTEISILLIDIDHFKKINDTYGHQAGDEILIEIAKQIKLCIRENDLVSRIGGEEFGVLLPDTLLQNAYIVAERICSHIASHSFTISNSKYPIKCTISIGLSTASPWSEEASNSLYKSADDRLYLAKKIGRNQVVSSDLAFR